MDNKNEYTPLWVKLLGGLIAFIIGGVIALMLCMAALNWYVESCPVGCKAEQILNDL